MSFLQTVKSSIFNPEFYSKIKDQSLGQALKYFFLLTLILTVISTLSLSYEIIITVPEEIKKFVKQTIDSFPANLEVIIDNGQVSTNLQEPFFVPFPLYETGQQSKFNNILVIDTKTPYSATQLNQYKTFLWLTRDSLFYENREFDQRSIDLSSINNFKIDRWFIESLAGKINPWLNFVGPVLILLLFFGLFIGYSFNLFYFLFLAVFIYFLSAIFKWGLNYSASYKTAIYASTLAFIIDLIILNTSIFTGFFGFPFLFTLTALCIVTINLQNLKEKS